MDSAGDLGTRRRRDRARLDRRARTRLKEALAAAAGAYDYILIDCPPSLGLLTVNALTAAHEIIIPVQAEYYALEGLSQLTTIVDRVRAGLNPDLRSSAC